MIGSAATYSLLFISLFFEVFMLVSFLDRTRGRAAIATRKYSDEALPKVAVIVPCFNEEKRLAATVRSLLALNYPAAKLEILIIDDGSTDGTLAVARKFETGEGVMPRVRIFHKQNGGKHSAMNLALSHTSAELVGCLDADSTVEPDALRRITPLFADQRIAAVTPGIHVREPKTMLQHMQHVEYDLSVFVRYILAALGSVFITPGPFSILRASIVRELGGWRHAHSTEDMEMALRIQEAGYLIANQPQAVVHTSTPPHMLGLFRQRVRWTYGWLRNAVDYRHMIGNRTYGNLSIIILPTALISIVACLYFFIRMIADLAQSVGNEIVRYQAGAGFPHPGFNLFFFPTSALLFLVWASVAIIVLLIAAGSLIGRGKHLPPAATPLFVLFYGFLVPLWLAAAVVRATFKTGVRWR